MNQEIKFCQKRGWGAQHDMEKVQEIGRRGKRGSAQNLGENVTVSAERTHVVDDRGDFNTQAHDETTTERERSSSFSPKVKSQSIIVFLESISASSLAPRPRPLAGIVCVCMGPCTFGFFMRLCVLLSVVAFVCWGRFFPPHLCVFFFLLLHWGFVPPNRLCLYHSCWWLLGAAGAPYDGAADWS